MGTTPTVHDRLYGWRIARKLTLKAAGTLAGVEHSTWSEWESGPKKPSLEKAIEVERVTDGNIRVEDWGYSAAQVDALREFAARRAKDDSADPDPAADTRDSQTPGA